MASNTDYLKLLKKDPVMDGNETFNIQTMLNDNWDKIDGAVGALKEEVAHLDPEIPDATTTNKGVVQLSNATDSSSEQLAATSKAIKSVMDAVNGSLKKASLIPVNVDLNNYKSEGEFYCPFSADASTLGNIPVKEAFYLKVSPAAGAIQFFSTFPPNNQRLFTRSFYSYDNRWGLWNEIMYNNTSYLEMRKGATTAGPAYIDFHTSGNDVDFDSRIIASNGTKQVGEGELTLQAGRVVTTGQVWIAQNTNFGATSNLKVPIGDNDTGFDWVADGQIDLYSNSQVPARLVGGDFQFKNTDGNFESLKQAIQTVKQSGANAKQSVVDSINAKRGSASTAMDWGQIVDAVKNISPVKSSINQSYEIANRKQEAGSVYYGPRWFTFPANTTMISFTATDTTGSYEFIRRNSGTFDGGTPLIRMMDSNGITFDILTIAKGGAENELRTAIRSWTFDARAREITIVWYEPRVSVFGVPGNFNINKEFYLLPGAIMGSVDSRNPETPTVYGSALKGNLLYM
ncbi:pyocin knob domain-containing protein [Paenibacillus sp. 8b26]|uniref:pyocin knob domain-containing protein n=1 Tax=Paenibacillus sp. 8b26 TaxID=3424133 RepID=UPI003D660E37